MTRGRAVFELDGERRDAPEGTFVFVAAELKRTAFAEEAGTMVVSVGGTPGKPYDPVGWELWYPLRKLYESGQYAEIVARGREAVEASPQYGILFYNLACCESLTGQTTDAIEAPPQGDRAVGAVSGLRKAGFGPRRNSRPASRQGATRRVTFPHRGPARPSVVATRALTLTQGESASSDRWENLIPIGQFAAASRLSLMALRLYDENGLLPPASVDPDSGHYRFYRVEQIRAATLIGLLRAAGMPLVEIRRVRVDPTPARVNEYAANLDEELVERRRVLAYVRRLLKDETNAASVRLGRAELARSASDVPRGRARRMT